MRTILDKIRYKDKKKFLTSTTGWPRDVVAYAALRRRRRRSRQRPGTNAIDRFSPSSICFGCHDFGRTNIILMQFHYVYCSFECLWCLCQNGAHNGVSLGHVYCCGDNTGIRMTLNRTSFVIMKCHYGFTVCWVGDTTYSAMTLSRTTLVLECYSVECHHHVECVASTSPFVATTFNTMTLSITALATVVYHSVVCIMLNVVAPTPLFDTEQHFILA